MKKVITLLLAIVMVVAMFAACAPADDTPGGNEGESKAPAGSQQPSAHVIYSFSDGHDVSESEECGLENCICSLAHTDFSCFINSVYNVEFEVFVYYETVFQVYQIQEL